VSNELRNWSDRDADAVLFAEGSIWRTDMRGVTGIAGVACPGHAYEGFPMNPGGLSASPLYGQQVTPKPKSPGLRGRGMPREKRITLKRSLLPPRETGGAGKGRRAVLRIHSTVEGGEPQGSRKGRPRYPPEGRDEQEDVLMRNHMHETLNSIRYVKWN